MTGASSGIGACFARRLASAGMDLIVVARRVHLLDALAQELEVKHRVRVRVQQADLRDPEQLAVTQARLRECSELALLVNNAGACRMGSFEELGAEAAAAQLRLNALAPALLMHTALAQFGRHRRGAVINVSSIAATMTTPFGASYCATKAYLSTLTNCVAAEIVDRDVRVQNLCIGLTRTQFPELAGMRTGDVPQSAWMEPEEVVEASLRALGRDQVNCTPRLADTLLPWFFRSLPRTLAHRVGRRAASGNGA